MFQMKEKGKSLEKGFHETERSDLADKEFKMKVLQMLTELRRSMNAHSENFNRGTENIRKYQLGVTELTTRIITVKKSKRGLQRHRPGVEGRTRELEDRAAGHAQSSKISCHFLPNLISLAMPPPEGFKSCVQDFFSPSLTPFSFIPFMVIFCFLCLHYSLLLWSTTNCDIQFKQGPRSTRVCRASIFRLSSKLGLQTYEE